MTMQIVTRLMQRLHDGPAQLMTLALLGLDQATDIQNAVAADGLDSIRAQVREALRATRQVLDEWGSATIAERPMSFGTSLINLGHWLSSFTGLALCIDCDDPVIDPPPPVAIVVLQAVQELLLNTCKHAPGAHVELALAALANGFELTVSDDGPGFDPVAVYQRHSANGGLGLFAMPERLARVDAAFNLQTGPGTGVHVCIRWPGDFVEQSWPGKRAAQLPGRMMAR
ncbi:MAG TPA: ATP-binding protein [Dyella sp.]|uniref:sensor histidine kinase n=1 Tax=Dyella sp. TaxID=1869338 RepID=UPI002C101137|nr:ATP-binding protein [Dyella sp.]HUB90433.1 ATP-binding protein [Dyella sp.]